MNIRKYACMIGLLVGFVANADRSGASEEGTANHLLGARRTGYTRQELSPPYHLAWTHKALHKPRHAWPEPAWEVQRIDFDYAYALAAVNGLVYYSSSSDHAVHALDLVTGETRWRYFTEGPVRLAPAVQGDRVFFLSDDGRVCCLDGQLGQLIWRHRPQIPDERLVGNEQIISRHPARSGVLVDGDRAYTTFGMLSPEGIVVACLNARTGEVLWQNETSGTRYETQPHFQAMGGISPQGYLALCNDVLVVPCGRATPAFFDSRSGELIYHESEGLFPGGAWTMTFGELAFTPCEYLKKPNPVLPGGSEAEILAEFARRSELAWSCVVGNHDAMRLREQLANAGLYGLRVAVHKVSTKPLRYADYVANLLVFLADSVADLREVSAAEVYRVTRPCGGVAVIACPDNWRPQVEQWLSADGIPRNEWKRVDLGYRIQRGNLPGAGAWTHQYADVGRSGASNDQLVRLPLKVLWFGGLAPADIVSRHYRSPAPLVVNGYLFAPGNKFLHAADAYNGRIIWQRELPGVGRWPAAHRGGSLAADEEGLFVPRKDTCLRLDPATGATLFKYRAPKVDGGAVPDITKRLAKSKGKKKPARLNEPAWEFLAVAENAVVGTIARPNIMRSWWSQARRVTSLTKTAISGTPSLGLPRSGHAARAAWADPGRTNCPWNY